MKKIRITLIIICVAAMLVGISTGFTGLGKTTAVAFITCIVSGILIGVCEVLEQNKPVS